MKYFPLLAAGLSCVSAYPIDDDLDMLSNILPANETEMYHKRDGPIPANTYLETALSTTSRTPGGQVATVRYGPFTVGAMSAVENLPVLRMASPCTDCYIVAMQADLEDTAGKVVNVDTGAWLHHMVISQTGLNQKDACGIPGNMRIFASGNERTAVRINNKYKYGIDHAAGANLAMIVDLMNIGKTPGQYKIAMKYEWIRKAGSGYKAADMVWNDIAGCISTSEVPARVGAYGLTSRPWRATKNYKLLSATGHEHDGGTMVTLMKNGQTICSSAQMYGRRPGYTESSMSGMNTGSGMAMSHISDTGSCVDFGTLNSGESLTIRADYNTNEHPLMKKMSGVGNEPIMGICQVYLGA